MDPEAFVHLGRLLGEHEAVTERLDEIVCPTTVIVGEEDAPFRRPSTIMTDAIPDACLDVIPNAAHSPQLENPESWRDAVLAHLKRARDRT